MKTHLIIKARFENFHVYNMFFAIAILCLFPSCKKDFTEVNTTVAANVDLLTATKTNIILIVGDDVGYEIPTYNGGQSYNTPNLDFMAANGTHLPNFFSHPDGPPSRLALMTGKYNYRNWVDFGYLPPDSKTIANMLHDDAGYKTCYVGKWQFDGGDVSIKKHGFDKYLVFMPFNPDDNNGHNQFYRRYKNPYLYQDARYLSDNAVKNKYSEDMFFNYASNFIDSNKTSPFFLLYSHNLVQHPWSPTPDDPDYANWNPSVDDDANEDKKYFPGMVAYMDKIIGKLINKIQASGLSNRTVIIFTSDNATAKHIKSQYKGQTVNGSKDLTIRAGLNVPLVSYGPGIVLSGKTDTSLTDLTDILPTLAGIAGIPKPSTWGPLDGKTFYDNLIGNPTRQRKWVYCYWPGYFKRETKSYVFDYNYKLYDSLSGGNFYNIRTDVNEQRPLKNSQLTPDEKDIKRKFKKILSEPLSQ